jgi:hypothetical protein
MAYAFETNAKYIKIKYDSVGCFWWWFRNLDKSSEWYLFILQQLKLGWSVLTIC